MRKRVWSARCTDTSVQGSGPSLNVNIQHSSGSFLDKVLRELFLGLFYGTHEVSCIFVAKANVDLTKKH